MSRNERFSRFALLLPVFLLACGEPAIESGPVELAPPPAPAPAPPPVEPLAEPEPPAPPPPPPPPPAPPPDPEAVAREREAAALERFEREYPLHGVAYHFLAQVHERPDNKTRVVGYLRRGAQFRAKEAVRGPGCERGWYEVVGGGFVCRGNGYVLGREPQTFDPSPTPPAIGDALPYVYARVGRHDVPQYWRIPSREEERAALEWIRAQRSPAAADDAPEPALEAPPGLGDASQANQEAPSSLADAGIDSAQPAQPPYLRMRMRRGFYVSLDSLVEDDGRRFYRTIRGGYVPADALVEATPPTSRGVVLGGRWSLPLAFVFRDGVRALSRDPVRGVLEMASPIERSTPLPLSSEIIERGGRRYRVSDRGVIVREDALRIARPIPRPARIPEDARWIHVDLKEQVLVAYEGDVPVFATLVSTGRAGHETPTGTFRVQSKHVSATMDDPDAGDESYSIEDVPWTLYFEGSYAIHGTFWHDRFGRVRSAGCVNLAPVDARWVFQWSEPPIPPGWHGVSSGRGEGTFVHVTDD